jgi:prophage maintenance system killer protein
MPPNRLNAPPRPVDGLMLLNRHFLNQYQMRLVTLFGGEPGLADAALLDRVLSEVEAVAGAERRGDVFEVAAAYAAGLARGPYLGGNLRLATVATATFLRLNEYAFAPDASALVETMEAVSRGGLDRPALAAWLRRYSRKIDPEDGGAAA